MLIEQFVPLGAQLAGLRPTLDDDAELTARWEQPGGPISASARQGQEDGARQGQEQAVRPAEVRACWRVSSLYVLVGSTRGGVAVGTSASRDAPRLVLDGSPGGLPPGVGARR